MKGFETKIKATNKQVTKFMQHAGVSRHAYNWGLNLCIERLRKNEKSLSAIDLHKLLVKNVKSQNEWYYDVSKFSPQQALRDLKEAFDRFWKIHYPKNKNLPMNKRYLKKYLKMKRDGKLEKLSIEHEKGFPKFKKKGVRDSFYLETPDKKGIVSDGKKIKVPIIGTLKTYEKLPENITIKNVTISRQADDWFISFISDRVCDFPKTKSDSEIGLDLGIKTLATTSDGEQFQSPKAYKKNKKKLIRLQKSLSRKNEVHKKLQALKDEECDKNKVKRVILPKSSNYKKNKIKLAKAHQRVANIRLDNTHKLTSNLSKNHREISIESLNVSGMMKNHNLASAIADGGFFEFKRQLIYKCEWRGVELNIIDQWFPSSQLCSCCGHKQKMPLKKRNFNCEKCLISIDRDLNAAINIRDYNEKWIEIYPQKNKNTVSYTGINACGDAKVQDESSVSVEIKKEAGIRQRTKHIGNVQVCVSS